MHSSQRSTYDELEKHLAFLRGLNIFGISDHDLMFSRQIEDNTEDNDPNAISEHFIKQKVLIFLKIYFIVSTGFFRGGGRGALYLKFCIKTYFGLLFYALNNVINNV